MARKIIGSVWDRENRNAINDNFEELYGYKNIAEFAKAKAESVQAQFNQVVIEGDSSVEAAQARVSADGTVYETLKERLDAEYNEVNDVLTQARVDAEGKTYPTLKARLDTKETEFSSQLAQAETQLITVNDKITNIDKGYGGSYATLTDLINAYPTGDTKRYVVIEDGNWYYWNGSEWVSGGVFQATVPPDELVFKATNLIRNGDFRNTLDGFVPQGGEVEPFTTTILTLKGDGTRGNIGIYTDVDNRYTGKANHKIYQRVRVRVRDSECIGIKVYASSGGIIANLNDDEYSVRLPAIDTWYDVSGIIQLPATFDGNSVTHGFYATYPTPETASGKTFEIFRPLAIDLTAIFGAGNEPTAKEVDELLSKFPYSFFNGTEDLQTVKQYMHTLNKKTEVKLMEFADLKKNKYKYDLQDDFSTPWTSAAPDKITAVNTTEKVLTGEYSLKVTVRDSQHILQYVDRQTDFLLRDKSKQMMVKFWVDNPKDIATINLYFGNESSAWANYGRMEFLGNGEGDAVQSGGLIRKGWNYLPIIPSAMDITGNFSWDLPIKKMRIAINSRVDEPVSVIFDSFWVNGIGKPKIVLTFDDGWKTVYENAFPKMKAHGIVGTTYVMGQYTDNPENPLSPNYMSLNELKELYENGWCIGNHAWAHEIYFLQNRTPIEYVNAINKNRDWILDNKLGDGALHYAYTNGEYDEHVVSLLQAHGYKSARAAKPRGHHPIIIDKPFEIVSRAFNSATSLDTAKKWVDYAVETGGTTFFQFHQIAINDTSTEPPNNPAMSFSKEKFDGLIDYIVEKGLANNCVAHDKWYEEGVREGIIDLG